MAGLGRGVIERYVLRELAVPIAAATVVLLALFYAMVLVRGVDFLLGSAAQPLDWLTLGNAMLPMLVPQVLPLSFLIGVMMGFARLGEDGELTALAAVGVSPVRLLRPVLLLALACCAVLSVTIFAWKPWGMQVMRQTARDVIERNILGDLQPGSVRADLPGVVFAAETVSPGPTWGGVVMIDERDGRGTQVLTAPRASASFETGVGISLQQGTVIQREAGDELLTTTFERGTVLFNVADALNRRDTFRFGHEELSPIDLLDRAREAEAGGGSGVGFRSAFHLRLSQLVAPLALALVATAVALAGRRRGARTAALIAFGVYLGWFVLSRVAVQLGEKGAVAPPVAGWSALVLTVIVGALALAWVSRRGARR
ncbi:MAG: LptF/LptG family permease [Myxococcaceae bacterium]